ncbi:DEAD/DEAH box helicase [Sphingorhabdus rigui]|uniref:preprotein translocase subunit SecA n=1 Tax=Sphingorhabdus rigui TaxID=1282858 RepID=UPI00160D2452|nr:DEAD/DEAH box helicase [Sphingorhabdus rigui]
MRHPDRLARSILERPQRTPLKEGIFHTLVHGGYGIWRRAWTRNNSQLSAVVTTILEVGAALETLNDEEFDDHVARLRLELLTRPNATAALVDAFAAIQEAAYRTIGQRPYPSQLFGAIAVYHGEIAEMQTGEGKTLTAVLPAAAAALAGIPVHVLTVNDYLAARDAENLGPVYRRLGLSVGLVVQDSSREQRRAAYACDVVYCSNKEIAFDYMRDSLVFGHSDHALLRHAARLKCDETMDRALTLRGLHFAIVDEADSVLLDEARTPLVISGTNQRNRQETKIYAQALEIADAMEEEVHFHVRTLTRQLEMTALGETRTDDLAASLGPAWAGRMRRRELVRSALVARHLLNQDAHYLVRDDKIIIIDDNTGRPMPDRNWEQGLHQLVEIKEGVTPTATWDPVARMTLQRFFRMYHHIGGMTGTAREVAGELWGTYDLVARKIPTNRASRLEYLGAIVADSITEKWWRVKERAVHLQAQGRPVLIGTNTVGASEQLSEVLTAAGCVHRVLNARQDRQEADIIAEAGAQGAVTIATNMAGRGTDIILADTVRDAGGLHIILTELHESARLDRQFFGRAGRQGDPGTYEIIASLEDEILVRNVPRIAARLAAMAESDYRARVAIAVMRFVQWRMGRLHTRTRADLLRMDEYEATSLAFAGRN